MSRRESRTSVNTRQNDALFEFENFKKKFLLANKHITKLNSTLSIRIEELNAQISTLYVENLRLRASEIALAAQLKREREKSRKIMAEAETASLNLTKQLSNLRQTFNIQTAAPPPPSPSSPRARQRPPRPDPNHVPGPDSPIRGPRIARPPNFPDINEENEHGSTPMPSDSEGIGGAKTHSTPTRRKSSSSKGSSSSSSSSGSSTISSARARLSASKLSLPARGEAAQLLDTPVPSTSRDTPRPTPHVDLTSASTKRKASRRQSGLVDSEAAKEALSVPRAPSPAFGSPVKREAVLAEAEEVAPEDAVDLLDFNEAEIQPVVKKERKKSIKREKDKERDKEAEPEEVIVVKKKRPRERVVNEDDLLEEESASARQSRLKDVTNSPRSKVALLLDDPPDTSSRPSSQLPTPRTSLSPAPEETTAAEDPNPLVGPGGRERRTRKSVNYAEPKLNTKMRKPDVIPPVAPPAAEALKKGRSSAAAVMSTVAYSKKPGMEGIKSRFQYDTNDDAEFETEDTAIGSASGSGSRSSTEQMKYYGSSSVSVDPALLPLPPSRPSSSLSAATRIGTPAPPTKTVSLTSTLISTTTSATNSSIKRKKSRHALVYSDDDDGAQADAEYGAYGDLGGTKSGGSDLEMLGVRGVSGWVNVESRRKGGTSSRRAIALQDVDEGRRHSMAL